MLNLSIEPILENGKTLVSWYYSNIISGKPQGYGVFTLEKDEKAYGFTQRDNKYEVLKCKQNDGLATLIQIRNHAPCGLAMFKFPWGVTFIGIYNNFETEIQGVVIDKNGSTVGAGIFKRNWLKHNGKLIMVWHLRWIPAQHWRFLHWVII